MELVLIIGGILFAFIFGAALILFVLIGQGASIGATLGTPFFSL